MRLLVWVCRVIDFPLCIIATAMIILIGTVVRALMFLTVPLALVGYTRPFRRLWTAAADTEDAVRDNVLGLFYPDDD